MNHFILCAAVIFLVSQQLLAQSNLRLKASIISAEGIPQSGNAILLLPADSSFYSGSFFIDGQLDIDNIPNQNQLLKLTSLEFRDTIIELHTLLNLSIGIDTIIVHQNNTILEAVKIVAKRPSFIQKPNGTVEVHIHGTSLSASNSATEILSRSPDVSIDANGQIGIFGKGNAILFLDNQRISTDQLRLIPPSSIRSIEIIRNPSVRYDAEGGAIIQINTLHSNNDSWRTNLQESLDYSSYSGWKNFVGANTSYCRGNFLIRSFGSFTRGRDHRQKKTTRNRSVENIALDSDLTTDWASLLNNYLYGIGSQLMLANKGYISLEYNCLSGENNGNILSSNTLLSDNVSGVYHVNIDQSERETKRSLSLNFETNFDSTRSGLFIGGQYAVFNSDYSNPIKEVNLTNGTTSIRDLFNKVDRNIRILSSQIDYSPDIKGIGTLSTGVKISAIDNISNNDFLLKTGNSNPINLQDLSSLFNYTETIIGTYAEFTQQVNDRTEYKLGLRSEHTSYKLRANLTTENISDKYNNIFPALSINHKISESYNMNLSYTSSINRQDYSRLNPGVIYQDPYTSIQGNPFLLPQKSKSIELTTKVKAMTFKLGYRHISLPFGGAAIPSADDFSYVLIRLNFDQTKEYYSSISYSFSSKGFTSSNTLSQYYSKTEEREFGIVSSSPRPHFYFFSTNRLKLPNGLNLEAVLWYHNSYRDGTFHRTPAGNITIGADQSFLNDRLIIRVLASDILHTQRADGFYSAGVTDITFQNKWNSNSIRLAVTYNLKANNKNIYKNKKIGSETISRTRK